MNASDERFVDLLHVDSVTPFPTGMDVECFYRLASIFERHGLIELLHVTLLHYHFDVTVSEEWVETTDLRRQVVAPASSEVILAESLAPTSWRIREREGGFHLIPLQFGPPRRTDAVNQLTQPAVDAIGETLLALGLLDRFGVATPPEIVSDPDQILLERPSVANRSLTTEPVHRSVLETGNPIGTSWNLRPFVITPTPVAWCKRDIPTMTCNRYCSTYCVTSGSGSHSGRSKHERDHSEGMSEPEKTYHYE